MTSVPSHRVLPVTPWVVAYRSGGLGEVIEMSLNLCPSGAVGGIRVSVLVRQGRIFTIGQWLHGKDRDREVQAREASHRISTGQGNGWEQSALFPTPVRQC